MATPLVTKADGTKFGKTEGGTVWLDAAMTSPYAFFQFWLNSEDAIVGNLLRIFTDRGREEIEALEQAVADRPAAREAQRALAADVTSLVHGEAATRSVQAASAALFGQGELAELDPATLADSLAELPRATVRWDGDGPLPLTVELFAEAGLVPSRSAARRTVAEGGAYLNNSRVTDPDHVAEPADLLAGRWLVLRRGRRSLAAVEVRR